MSKNPVLKPFADNLETPAGFWTGFVASASTLPGILLSLPAASLSDIFGRRKIQLISATVFASAQFFYLFITIWWQLILVRFYHGFATAVFVPVAQASIVELFPTKRRERISFFSSATDVRRGIAPFLGAYLLYTTSTNFQVLYLAVAVAGITAFIMALSFPVEKNQKSIMQNKYAKGIINRMSRGGEAVVGNNNVLIASLV